MKRDSAVGRSRRTPAEVRDHTFGTKMRGLDPEEVTRFQAELADQLAAAEANSAELQAELDKLRARDPGQEQRAEITSHAVDLLSQAQQIADTLVAEAEQYARDMIESTRNQQREALIKARQSVEIAARNLPNAVTPSVPASELEYVRTFTQVAHVQLRSVLDALAEQVEKLGRFTVDPTATPGENPAVAPGEKRGPIPSGLGKEKPVEVTSGDDVDLQWWVDLSNTRRPPGPPT